MTLVNFELTKKAEINIQKFMYDNFSSNGEKINKHSAINKMLEEFYEK